MNKQISLLLFIIWFSINAFSQSSEFEWHFSPSFNHAYTMKIKNNNNTNFSIQMNLPNSDDSICSKISKTDCDSLMTFLSNYLFNKHRRGILKPGIRKAYQDTKLLNDSNWILLNGDSIRYSSLRLNGLMYEKETKRYYYEFHEMVIFTDGTHYKGKFVTDNLTKEFDVISFRISEMDYKLNMMVVNLINKYFSNLDYSFLLKEINNDKPVPKRYQ